MIRTALAALALASFGAIAAANAVEAPKPTPEEKLLIVNGNTGHVIYDDGRDDLFCVTRRRVIGYNQYGHRVYRRNMRCR